MPKGDKICHHNFKTREPSSKFDTFLKPSRQGEPHIQGELPILPYLREVSLSLHTPFKIVN